MEYFEDGQWPKTGDWVCSHDECLCGNAPITRGEGYLFVSETVAVLRMEFPSHVDACVELDRRIRETYGRPVSYRVKVGPMLICESAARQRALDLDIARADALKWWESGQAPLRSTPLKGSRLAEEERIYRELK